MQETQQMNFMCHWKKRHMSRKTKVGMCEEIVETTLLYGCSLGIECARVMKSRGSSNNLCSICGVRIDIKEIQ